MTGALSEGGVTSTDLRAAGPFFIGGPLDA